MACVSYCGSGFNLTRLSLSIASKKVEVTVVFFFFYLGRGGLSGCPCLAHIDLVPANNACTLLDVLFCVAQLLCL